MTQGPIIDEVRALRDELAKEHGYYIGAIFAALRQLEATSGREHLSLPARRLPEPTAPNVPRKTDQPGAAPDGGTRRV